MISQNNLISKIADKNFNKDEFVELVINDKASRDEIVNQMLNNKDIMIYYHSYYVIFRASELEPELFYGYWDSFVSLLDHDNSYHRDFGLDLIANLTEVDIDNKFPSISNEYFKHINDSKLSTARHCIQNTGKILVNKPDLMEATIDMLLDVDALSDFPLKQKALLKSDIIKVFHEFYQQINDKKRINKFVEDQLDNISPKTRKVAKDFLKEY